MRFGPFVLDPILGELRKSGTLIRLQGQPMQLLLLLLERPGEIVTREEMQQKLWTADTFVEFDAGLNTAIKKVRQALGDTAENPRYIETLPKLGYRFVAPVHTVVVEMPPPAAVAAPSIPTPSVPQPSKRLPAILAVVAAVALVSVALGVFFSRKAPVPTAPTRFEILLPADHSLGNTYSRGIALSPNGRTLVYAAWHSGQWRLFRREMSELESHPIPGSEDSWAPFFTPDGQRILYVRGSEFRSTRLDGSDLRKEVQLNPALLAGWASGAWGQNGDFYYTDVPPKTAASQPSAALWVKSGQRPPHPLTAKLFGQGPEWHFVQQEIPGAHQLLFSIVRTPEDRDIAVYSLATGDAKTIVRGGTGGLYLPTGHLLYSVYTKGRRLFAAPFDSSRLEVTGAPIELPAVAHDSWRKPTLAVSESGTLIYRPAPTTEANELTWVDLNGRQSSLPVPPGPYSVLDISPSGSELLIARQEPPDSLWYVWRYELDSGAWTRSGVGSRSRPQAIWAPSASEFVTSSELHGSALSNIYLAGFDGATPKRLTESHFGQYPSSWSKASNLIAYVEGTRPGRGSDIWIKDMSTGGPAREWLNTSEYESNPAFSPDGRWIAYATDSGVFVRAYPDGAPWQVTESGSGPLWSPDGKTIYFRLKGGVSAATFQPGPSPAIGQPRVLFGGDYRMPDHWSRNYSLSPDGKRFLMLKLEQNPLRDRTLRVVLNWFEELSKRN